MRAQLYFVLSQITRLTDRHTEYSSLDHVCIPCSAVIKLNFDIFDRCKIVGGVGEVSELERISIIVARGGSIRFPISSSVLKRQSVKGDWCQKSNQNLGLFDPL